ncbi:MAG: DUF4886 domain-containing protein [Tepidisphaeraceae bacterium]
MTSFRRVRWLCVLIVLLYAARPASAEMPATRPAGKTVRVLAIGNSFSGNALKYLPQLAEAGGHRLVAVNAYIGGASFERHMKAVAAFEADPNDKAGRPYKITGDDGKPKMVSLRELLQSQPWEFVTLQQSSPLSYKPESYQPCADQLVAYVHQFAPQAKLLLHQTWAYRVDHDLFKHGDFTQQQMYQRITAGYQSLATHIGAAGVIPAGTAIQNMREDPRWIESIEYTDPKTLKKPDQISHSLNADYYWGTLPGGRSGFVTDRFHLSPAGCLIAGAVWYEFFFHDDVRQNAFVPKDVPADEAVWFKEIAPPNRHRRRPPEAPRQHTAGDHGLKPPGDFLCFSADKPLPRR